MKIKKILLDISKSGQFWETDINKELEGAINVYVTPNPYHTVSNIYKAPTQLFIYAFYPDDKQGNLC